ncbi:MAG TPA: hypothetical protein VLK36_01710 [Gaiellaceae bacterium]|nr:hypothetical protein [Gaiellaceae bacterium]
MSSTDLCAAFGTCDSLDARVLVSTAFQGPPLSISLDDLSFGGFSTTGAAARPYIDVRVEQGWIGREACYGPVRSIFSLAPGETVQLTVVAEQRSSLVKTIADHLPNVIDKPAIGPFLPIGSLHLGEAAATAAGTQAARPPLQAGFNTQLQRSSQFIGAYGSFLEDLADPLGVHKVLGGGSGGSPLPTPPSPVDVANGISGLIKGATGGSQSVVGTAVGAVAGAAKSAGHTDSTHTRDETTTTTTSSERTETLTRTFSNPYRDRSLQLRFIPVFRRFEVTTAPAKATVGVALHAGAFKQVATPLGAAREQLSQAPVLADVVEHPAHADLQRSLSSMLSATPVAEAHRALTWSQAELRENSLLVPLAPGATAAKALGLRGDSRSKLISAVGRGVSDAISAIRPHVQSVHLYMGTHIEAVAGGCVLTDLPPIVVTPNDG